MKTLAILMIVTSAATMGQGGEPTGVWFEELAAPYYVFKDAGYDVTIASIDGGEVPIDPRSMNEEDKPASVERFLKDQTAMQAVNDTPSIAEVKIDDYAAVFLPGGHGTMWDFPDNPRLNEIISKVFQRGDPVAAVCHGPAGLIGAKDASGEPIVKGRQVTAFTNSEEEAAGLTEAVPFLLQSKLERLGAEFVPAGDFQPNAVKDGPLVTGQNPASSKAAAELVVEIIREHETSLK